jgi:hypothetical protein
MPRHDTDRPPMSGPVVRLVQCRLCLAAWIGLLRKHNSGAGKQRPRGITNQGNRYLRQMSVVGAMG